MGALANVKNNLKDSKIGLMIADTYRLLLTMVNSNEESDYSIQEAIDITRKGNPEEATELEKVFDAINYETEKLNKQAEEQFGKDEYIEIPDKVTNNLKAEVSEKEALEEGKGRAKGGRQKTRVDED